mmetsp:Transcript_24936/g.45089  ORF Transcript_24936/g.45089 Transcript_24936/m.45089 type:complete len:129 (+) Transcript_24936:24-410(+)
MVLTTYNLHCIVDLMNHTCVHHYHHIIHGALQTKQRPSLTLPGTVNGMVLNNVILKHFSPQSSQSPLNFRPCLTSSAVFLPAPLAMSPPSMAMLRAATLAFADRWNFALGVSPTPARATLPDMLLAAR